MATKNCPHCNKQVPVACKKCVCGHLFFATRRSATSISRDNNDCPPGDTPELEVPPGDASTSSQALGKATRRSGRVTRERPNFYDALEYENQTRRDDNDLNRIFPHIFVTVGSTKYDELVKLVLKDDKTLQQLHRWKTTHVVVQKGNSDALGAKESFTVEGIHFQVYDYKSFLAEDMKWADLVICHAGAGTTLEALELRKSLIVVPNRNLMDDHQLELASKLAEGNHAILTSISTFHNDVMDIKRSWFVPLPDRKTDQFVNYLNSNQKILRRKQSKQPKSDEHDDGSDEGEVKSSQSTSSSQKSSHDKSIKDSSKFGEPKVKKRRGRPPGITGRKTNQGYKIHHNRATVRTRRASNGQVFKNPDSPGVEKARMEEEKNILSGVTPEKALQYNIVLQDINSKITRVSWKAS